MRLLKEKYQLNSFPNRGLISLLLTLVFSIGLAQKFDNVHFDRLSTENEKIVQGLSQNWIYCVLQDKYGYMWFGTWDGLNKYDAYEFTTYNVEDGLSDHVIYSLLEDDEGYLWIGTEKGFNKFDRKTQTFTQYIHIPGDSNSLVNNRVNSIIQARDGTFWLGTGGGLNHFDKKTESFTPYLSTRQDFYSLRSNYIINVFQDTDGVLWISTSSGLVMFDPKTAQSTRYYHIESDPNSISHNNVRCVLQDNYGGLWIGTRSGLNYYNKTTREMKHYFSNPDDPFSLTNNWVRTIYKDNSGEIWIGTESGLNYYNREQDNFVRYTNILNDAGSLSHNRVYSVYEDRSGNFWIGTYKGVNKIVRYHNDFKHIKQTAFDETSLNNNVIWNFAEDNKDNLWICTGKGVSIKNTKTGKFTFLEPHPEDARSLSDNDVRVLNYCPSLNCMWLGTFGGGLDKYDLNTNEIKHYRYNPNKNSLSSNYVNDVILDRDGLVWIASGKGLNCFNPATGRFKVYFSDPENKNSPSNNITICLLEDTDGDIWIGTDDGLNKYIKSEDKFIRYISIPEDETSLSNNTIFSIYQDKTGVIWIGTSGGGINRLDAGTGTFKSYTTKDGLPNNVLYGILEDDNGHLWISTNLGLSKFYTHEERFVNYDVKDGIQSNEFNLGACYIDKNGLFYFGGMNGYNVFDPLKIIHNPNKPVVVITDLRKFNEVQHHEYFNNDTIELNYDDNYFSFEISALDYTNPIKNKYKYMLEGIDKEWIYTGAGNRLAEYKRVRPGTYTFKANGSNNDGVWNEEGISLNVIIHPPWWETWYFRVFIVLLIIVSLWYLNLRRARKIKRKQEVQQKMLEIEKQMFELEQKTLRLQMNPHFIFNSLNSIQSYIINHKTELAVAYLSTFSQLMRLILANSGSKFIVLKKELRSLKYYLELEKLRFDNKFEFHISVDKNIDDEFMAIPTMLIQPYVENAIIHGLLNKPGKGKIDIRFVLHNETIRCTITDNGIGREKAMQLSRNSGIIKKSQGMMITKSRLEVLNKQYGGGFSVEVADLKDNKGNASGTEVKLVIHFIED
jgi:ligand-binding sensor domain-containing protein